MSRLNPCLLHSSVDDFIHGILAEAVLQPCEGCLPIAPGLNEAEAKKSPFIASMGIYVFKKDLMLKLLREKTKYNDFGGEIIPEAAASSRVMAYLFNDYWEDIGTIKSFFEANLGLAQQVLPPIPVHDACHESFTLLAPPHLIMDWLIAQERQCSIGAKSYVHVRAYLFISMHACNFVTNAFTVDTLFTGAAAAL